MSEMNIFFETETKMKIKKKNYLGYDSALARTARSFYQDVELIIRV
jgi:hypothetical protein